MTDSTALASPADIKSTTRTLTRELPDSFRELRVAVLSETLAHGVPVSPLSLTVVLSAIDEQVDDPYALTVADVEQLLWVGVARFCEEIGLDVPDRCAEALHAAIATALRIGWLSADADCPKRLFGPFQQMGLAKSRATGGRRDVR